jgi:hypothetical protein
MAVVDYTDDSQKHVEVSILSRYSETLFSSHCNQLSSVTPYSLLLCGSKPVLWSRRDTRVIRLSSFPSASSEQEMPQLFGMSQPITVSARTKARPCQRAPRFITSSVAVAVV